MPRLLAVGGPRDGHRMFVEDDAAQGSLFVERASLSQSFFEELKKHPVPVEEAAVRQIANNSLALASGDEVMVHDSVPDGVDLEQLHERARAKLERDGDWAEQD